MPVVVPEEITVEQAVGLVDAGASTVVVRHEPELDPDAVAPERFTPQPEATHGLTLEIVARVETGATAGEFAGKLPPVEQIDHAI